MGVPSRPISSVIHPPPEHTRPLDPLVPGLPTHLRRWAVEVVQIVLLTALLYAVVTTFVAQPYEVEMSSMEPTLLPGDHILLDKLSLAWSDPQHGDLVVFDAPDGFADDGIPYVKRVVAVAGETVQLLNGRLWITPVGGSPAPLDEPYVADSGLTLPLGRSGPTRWTVPAGSVFVLGDNRTDSVDSRRFGPIPEDRIIGRAFVRYLPLERVAVLGGTQPADVTPRP